MKVIALYFPQFHRIKENDLWWGEGFTDWVNVRRARRQFVGHRQPRIPLNKNYYDQSQIDTIRWQVRLAREHGIHGFCHYHYWFDGHQLLETPTELLLQNPDIDMPFCLSWANETWSRRWDGQDHHILMQQSHPPDIRSWRRHFEYLIRAWTDPRAIRIEGKPVFVIYRPQNIEQIDRMLEHWRQWAQEAGLPGLYIVFQKQYSIEAHRFLNGFDAQFQFQPFETMFSGVLRTSRSDGDDTWAARLQKLGSAFEWRLNSFRARLGLPALDQPLKHLRSKFGLTRPTIVSYDQVWARAITVPDGSGLTTFPGAFVDWDNTARYKNRAIIFEGATPERFKFWLQALAHSLQHRDLPAPFVFLNAWNEWSEGTYLEPDETHGYRYLEAVRSVVAASRPVRPSPRPLVQASF